MLCRYSYGPRHRGLLKFHCLNKMHSQVAVTLGKSWLPKGSVAKLPLLAYFRESVGRCSPLFLTLLATVSYSRQLYPGKWIPFTNGIHGALVQSRRPKARAC